MKAKILDIKRFQNEDNQTSVCVIKSVIPFPNEEIVMSFKDLEKIIKKFKSSDMTLDMRGITISTVGVARLAKEDTFDKLIGKRVAESKAKKALFNAIMRLNRELRLFYLTKMEATTKNMERYLELAEKESDHIKELAD